MCICVVVKHENFYSKGIFWENIQKIALKREMRQVFWDNFFLQKRHVEEDGGGILYYLSSAQLVQFILTFLLFEY